MGPGATTPAAPCSEVRFYAHRKESSWEWLCYVKLSTELTGERWESSTWRRIPPITEPEDAYNLARAVLREALKSK